MALEIETPHAPTQKESLSDALGTILDKGLVIAGDISIHLVKTELLTIKVRLILASVDRAEKMGIDWWKRDAFLTDVPSDSRPLADVDDTIEASFNAMSEASEAKELDR